MSLDRRVSMQELQQSMHGEGHDYAAGSPHIKHYALRSRIVHILQDAVQEVFDRNGTCRVLEVGAGHGTFTDHLVAVGATVEVTEMSEPSAIELRRRFANNPAVHIILDPDGSASTTGAPVDLVVCLSVLHHIPDYMAAVAAMLERITAGGTFISFQDPLWYSRTLPTRRTAGLPFVAFVARELPTGHFH